MAIYCKDCVHVQQSETGWRFWRCKHPENQDGVNPVSGEPKTVWTFCQEMRGEGSPCGPDAKLFEAKHG